MLWKVMEVEHEASADEETLWDCLSAHDENCLICSKFTPLINTQFKHQKKEAKSASGFLRCEGAIRLL